MSPILSDCDRDGYAAMDDCADWANGEARQSSCAADACNQGRKPCPCPQACTVAPRERMGRFHGWERILIEHPTAVAVVSTCAFVFLVWCTKP